MTTDPPSLRGLGQTMVMELPAVSNQRGIPGAPGTLNECFALNDEKRKSTSERLSLCRIPILEGYSSLLPEMFFEMESTIAESIPNLSHVKKNEFLLQKNYREQAKHEEIKCEYRLDKEKVLIEDAAIRRWQEQRRAEARKVQDHPLLKLLLN